MRSAVPQPPTDPLPLRELATCARPHEEHAALRQRGVHRREGAWVVARPDDVVEALASPALRVPPLVPSVGEAVRLQARMARFSDGPEHLRRRALVEAVLPEVDGTEEAARRRTEAGVGRRTTFDAMSLARTVPVAALAAAMGVVLADVGGVVELVGRLSDALAPSFSPLPVPPHADAAALELEERLAPIGPWDDEHVAAAAGVLFQAGDATAALIGACVSSDDGTDGDPSHRIERVLHQHAPVQCTRRVAVDDVVLGGVAVPRGATLWVVLAAGERGPGTPPATFGSGPHVCPGSSLARALAGGVVAALRDGGWRPVPGQSVRHEGRPNLRLPARIVVERR